MGDNQSAAIRMLEAEKAELILRLRELALKVETLASDAIRCAAKAREYLEYTERLSQSDEP